MTGWSKPASYTSPQRFREYRRFTSSVAAALVFLEKDTENIRVANYLARDLIIDADPTDKEHFDAVANVFPVLQNTLEISLDVEHSFFTLGSLILSHMSNNYDKMAEFAERLKKEESEAIYSWCNKKDSRFPFGITIFDQLKEDWDTFIAGLTNPNNDKEVQFILDGLNKTTT